MAAERQFRRDGYAGTSVDDIATVTGLGRGSLYAAFGDKHGLFVEALGGYCARIEATIAKLTAGPDSTAAQRLRLFLTSSARLVADSEDGFGCMAARFAVEVGDDDEAARTRIALTFERLRDALGDCVRAAQRYGDLDPAVDSHAAAHLLLAAARGMDVLAKAGVSAADLDRAAALPIAGLSDTSPHL